MTRIVAADTDTLLEDVIAEAHADRSSPLAERVLALNRALCRGDPWPTAWAGPRVDDVATADDGPV